MLKTNQTRKNHRGHFYSREHSMKRGDALNPKFEYFDLIG